MKAWSCTALVVTAASQAGAKAPGGGSWSPGTQTLERELCLPLYCVHILSSLPAGLAWSGRALSCQVTAACSSSGSPCRSFPQLIHGPPGRGCGQNGLCFPGPCVPSRRWEARMGPVTKGFPTCDGRDVDRHTAGCFGVGLGRWKSCRLNSLRRLLRGGSALPKT